MTKKVLGNGDLPSDSLITGIAEWQALSGKDSFPRKLSERVYEYLVDKIFFNKLEPGTRLLELDIAKKLNVSTGPVREAMFQMRQEGWIEYIPNCGSKIIDFKDLNRFRNLYNNRVIIETGAARLLAKKSDTESLKPLHKWMTALEDIVAQRKSVRDYRIADAMFHQEMITLAGGESLQKVYRPIFLQWCMIIYLTLATGNATGNVAGNEEFFRVNVDVCNRQFGHQALYQALENHDGEKAMRIIYDHISNVAMRYGVE